MYKNWSELKQPKPLLQFHFFQNHASFKKLQDLDAILFNYRSLVVTTASPKTFDMVVTLYLLITYVTAYLV
jgi:hypothetical protein